MMIGSLTGNSILTAYLPTAFFCVAGFAVYDIRSRRVPDRALAFFLPFAALSPVLRLFPLWEAGLHPIWFLPIWLDALSGAMFGFTVLLAAALVSGSSGMGGGDIKFAGVLGLIYGVSGMALIFLIAAALAMPTALFIRRFSGKRMLSMPFLPFLACGCLVATVVQLFG